MINVPSESTGTLDITSDFFSSFKYINDDDHWFSDSDSSTNCKVIFDSNVKVSFYCDNLNEDYNGSRLVTITNGTFNF